MRVPQGEAAATGAKDDISDVLPPLDRRKDSVSFKPRLMGSAVRTTSWAGKANPAGREHRRPHRGIGGGFGPDVNGISVRYSESHYAR